MGRRASPRVLFGYFLHDAKSDNPFPFAGSIEVLQTSIQRTKITTSCNPIKSFCRSAASSGGYAAFFVACGNRSPPWRLFFSPYGGIPAGTAHSVCLFAALGGTLLVAIATTPAALRLCAQPWQYRHTQRTQTSHADRTNSIQSSR